VFLNSSSDQLPSECSFSRYVKYSTFAVIRDYVSNLSFVLSPSFPLFSSSSSSSSSSSGFLVNSCIVSCDLLELCFMTLH